MVSQCKLVERAVVAIDAVQSSQQVLEVAGKEGAVQVLLVGQRLIFLVHNEVCRLVAHDGEHLLAVVANHLAVAPGDGCREQRHNLDVGKAGKPPRKLHGILRYEAGGVDSCRLSVENLFQAVDVVFESLHDRVEELVFMSLVFVLH